MISHPYLTSSSVPFCRRAYCVFIYQHLGQIQMSYFKNKCKKKIWCRCSLVANDYFSFLWITNILSHIQPHILHIIVLSSSLVQFYVLSSTKIIVNNLLIKSVTFILHALTSLSLYITKPYFTTTVLTGAEITLPSKLGFLPRCSPPTPQSHLQSPRVLQSCTLISYQLFVLPYLTPLNSRSAACLLSHSVLKTLCLHTDSSFLLPSLSDLSARRCQRSHGTDRLTSYFCFCNLTIDVSRLQLQEKKYFFCIYKSQMNSVLFI